ncbi:MAG TPA: hypothetical protein VEL12_10190 [Candidatus Nitrosopolaris sp.]|nr:hypothetical protein [Candidatus Nitrosopolaris sp.]
MTEPEGERQGPKQVSPEPWRAGIDTDRRKRRRRITNQRAALRQLTVGAAVAATALNAVLFVQTGLDQSGAAAVQNAILSVVNAVSTSGTNTDANR